MSYVYISLGILALLYYIVLGVKLGTWDTVFSGFWIFAGFAFLLLGKWAFSLGREGNLILGIVFLALFHLFACGLNKIAREATKNPPEDLKVIIIPGAHVHGQEPSLTLKRRLDAALMYGQKKEILYIVTGGRGRGEDISEALAMKRYLEKNGILQEKILLENMSTTTYENFRFSLQKFPDLKKEKIGIATSDYHIARSKKMAREAGFWHVYGIPAPTRKVMQPNFLMRECFAAGKYFFVTWNRKKL